MTETGKENEKYLREQIITYLGNKRNFADIISTETGAILARLGKRAAVTCDLFSGSGVVARVLKRFSSVLHANDLEKYSYVINDCYLTNRGDFDGELYDELRRELDSREPVEGIITKNYAPADDENILEGERVFFTHENAVRIDTARKFVDDCVPDGYKKFFLAPLLYEASVHNNTSGVFKGFYKSKTRNVGKFGGEGGNALKRITGKIELKKPVFSNFNCQTVLHNEDSNQLAKKLKNLDVTYVDPPYNQHPYGSNYFMLNTILENRLGGEISRVAGIPKGWNKSAYNKKSSAAGAFGNLVSDLDSKFVIISYNNEGIMDVGEMESMLRGLGRLNVRPIDYVTFRGCRNLRSRDHHTTEYVFVLEKS